MILNGGRQDDTITISYVNQDGRSRRYQTHYEGVVPNLQRRYRETTSDYVRSDLERYMTERPCPTCKGSACAPRRWPSPCWIKTLIRRVTFRSRRFCGGWRAWPACAASEAERATTAWNRSPTPR